MAASKASILLYFIYHLRLTLWTIIFFQIASLFSLMIWKPDTDDPGVIKTKRCTTSRTFPVKESRNVIAVAAGTMAEPR